MANRDLVAIGGSLGALEAATTLLAGLPPDLRTALLVTITAAGERDAAQFDRAGPLPAAVAVDGQALRPGRVYLAGPDPEGATRAAARPPREGGGRGVYPGYRSCP
ncbi:chemotaxis protein CheB [Actinoplanes teichomyceticus]|uniref:CheB methylesterase n=1 Tax=Actinoplanes teichomyceticus TaxID=1867 RepID=A0A561VCI9_ACTTI|nr:chemotaxis protein CheB [Actinoplanes teichomyceticus]TWG09326.1 CheB methylesterase [Actinoplanes teichomyceticus]GIF16650.1 hypothetical protein Ate01nite_66820 [Actinoplanes teichomyceticus]